jgi:carbon-monoxide dehydrogenase medium subunit
VILGRAETLEAALERKAQRGEEARILAGGTDLVVELRGTDGQELHQQAPLELVDITRLDGLDGIDVTDTTVTIGCLATHARVARHAAIHAHAPLLAAACAQVGSPPIRHRGTVAGNVCNASACADTLPPLLALDARLVAHSMRGERVLPVTDAVLAPYRTALAPDEMLTRIFFDRPAPETRSVFLKLGRRNALSVSRMSIAVVARLDPGGRWRDVRVAGGSVAPTPCRFTAIERLLEGEAAGEALAAEAGARLAAEMVALTGRRWSTPYKEPVVGALLGRALGMLRAGNTPELDATRAEQRPPAAAVAPPPARPAGPAGESIDVELVVNGRLVRVQLPALTTLLELLRDTLGLTGTKCGCEIGECGACTVLLDGQAVNSCLVLAGQAHGRRVETVEGLAAGLGDGALHPLQRAFLDHDAVACGFCTPGMLMSAKALLDHVRRPSRLEIRTALSGNLCRCTGYIPIVDAVEHAARELATVPHAAPADREEARDGED